MTEVTRIYNAERRSFSNVQRCYSGQQYDSASTVLHFEYDPIDFLNGYTPYIMFEVFDKDGNPLVYGPSSSPKFDGYTFPIPYEVTAFAKSMRLEYQLYFVSTGGFVYDETLKRYVEEENGTEYHLSVKDGVAIKPSISPRKGCGCPPPIMAPVTEPSVVGYINLWKEKGLIAPVGTKYDESTGNYTITFQTFNGDEFQVDMKVALEYLNTLREDIIVNRTVGGIKAGTTIPAGTKYEDIFKMALHIDPMESLIARYGASTEFPVDYMGLVQDDTVTWDDLVGDGWDVTIITGTTVGGVNQPQYATIAVSKELTLDSWYVKEAPFIDFAAEGSVVKVSNENYNIWYLETPTFDADLDEPGTEYIIKFKEN